MSVLASLLITGCSQEEVTPPGGEDDGGSGTSYMAINLISSDALGSRAANGYEDGSTTENHVKKVRFYFFNGLGGAVNVKLQGGSYVNYYDWEPNTKDDYPSSGADPDQTVDGDQTDDIESKLKAVIVINTAAGDGIPQRIAAVLNPPTIDGTPLLGSESLSLTDLKDKVADFSKSSLTQKGTFVMFNSVGGGGKDISTTLIEDKNLCKSEANAIANPVTIYVERSVAKVRVTLGDDVKAAANDKLALKDKDGNNIKVDNQQVYLKLLGWGLTAETSEGRLIKKVNPAWEGNWWYAQYRSFWAINSMTATNRYPNSYETIGTSFGNGNALYTNENAQLTDIGGQAGLATRKTKVILKGELCKADGSAFTIVRHLGVYFADEKSDTESANFLKLKESILNQLSASKNLYYYANKNEEGKETGRTQIGINDIKIVVADQKEQEESKNNCYVYAQLTEDAAKKTWYTSSEGGTAITDAAKVINGKLANKEIVDRALAWKSGMTYYYYEIKHLNNNIGVVRNHIYATNVTAIAGLGTPVYDPDEIIYPEKPDPNNHYIAAEIMILSWRVVNNDYPLEW